MLKLTGEGRLPLKVEEGLFRITQEALNNVVKHANTSEASVELTFKERLTTLVIGDKGAGFDLVSAQAKTGHVGLASMRERAQALGGKMSVDSSPGKGTRIKIVIDSSTGGDSTLPVKMIMRKTTRRPKMPENKIKVLIVDDHAIVRQGLRTLLELMDDISVVGEAANGKIAIDLVSQIHPDVVMMDLMMPEMDGITATRQICAQNPGIKIIALTSFLEDENIIPAIQAGATSFLLKDVSPTELVDTIRAAYRGEARLHPNVARKLMDQVSSHPASLENSLGDITDREMEVLRLVAQGMSNKEIASTLVISEKTVKTHISSLLGKLNLNDRTQLAIYALKNGLIKE